MRIEEKFRGRWNFPGCVGAIDGKHIQIMCPPESGSLFYNYKKTYSIVLLALVDAEYNILYIDVGTPGSGGDGGIWKSSSLFKAIEGEKAKLPESVNLPGK